MSTSFPGPNPYIRPIVAEPSDPFGAVNPMLVGDCGTMLTRLYHFLDGELTNERRTKIQSHLDGCPSCYSVYDFEAELRMVIANRAQCQVPSGLMKRIKLSLAQCQSGEPGEPDRDFPLS